jgi:hypothetical protein
MRKDGESEFDAVLPRFRFYPGCFVPDIGYLPAFAGGAGLLSLLELRQGYG